MCQINPDERQLLSENYVSNLVNNILAHVISELHIEKKKKRTFAITD